MVHLKRLLSMDDDERIDETALLNGDFYVGKFKGVLPHGKGKYIWSNGTVYEGDWEEGKMTGKGQITWSSGAKYEGDFSGSFLHGFGTFIGPDGSEYRGVWRMNIQHGLGRKRYSNLDVYEGSWNEGVHEGIGRYSWISGNTYIGNWKSGKMCGRGVMKWANGDLCDCFWLNGFRHGSGVYRFADGGYYSGMWSMGIKDGKGTFYPPGTKPPSLRRWCSSLGCYENGKSLLSHSSSLNLGGENRVKKPRFMRSLSEKMSVTGRLRNSGRISHGTASLDETWSLNNSSREFICREPSCVLSHTSDEGQNDVQSNSNVVYEREYVQGVLTNERVRTTEPSHKTKHRNKFHLKEIRKKSCVDIFEGHKSYYLKLNLQLGIRYTVGKITPVPMREVRASDFGDRARIRMYFPQKGSQFTPPHCSIDFYWKDYCPMVFRNLREMFKLDAAEYMMSICGDDGLREISSPGKSGSIFYLSHDDRFVIKTLKKYELKDLDVKSHLGCTQVLFQLKKASGVDLISLNIKDILESLLKMLHKYYNHVGKHENTLITKFFGVHRITLRGGKKVRFVVMGNMFCTELRIHRRYDLKGSSHGRYTDKDKITENTTLKDLDLAYDFHMDKLLREALFKQLSMDCMFLESQQIIDYSLLLGLHFRAPEHLKVVLELPGRMPDQESLPVGDSVKSQVELPIPPNGLVLVTHEPSFVSTMPGPHSRGNTLRAHSVGEREVDLMVPGTGRLRVQLGVNMPAQALHKLQQDEVDSKEIELFEIYDVVLYMGIIDILQEYNVKKKVEHAYKSLRFDPLSISVVEPKTYAKRFINFLHKIFPAEQ